MYSDAANRRSINSRRGIVAAFSSRSRSFQLRLVLILVAILGTAFVSFHAAPDSTQKQLTNLSRSSLEKIQAAAAARLHVWNKDDSPQNCLELKVEPTKEDSEFNRPKKQIHMDADRKLELEKEKETERLQQDTAEDAADEDEFVRVESNAASKSSAVSDAFRYPAPANPPDKGFGALSRSDNPWRERFLIPLYACNEQETGSQMHVRTLLHLAKSTNRTLVLPRWGRGIPTVSNCRPYDWDTIYETESTNSIGLWSVPYRTWVDWLNRNKKSKLNLLRARISVIFFRETHKYLSEQIANSDQEILRDGCIDPSPFEFDEDGAPLYIATTSVTSLDHLVSDLRETDHLPALFVFFNHYSELLLPDQTRFPDPLLQERPQEWGLWVGRPFPQWNLSSTVMKMAEKAQANLPREYAALQWRMELVKPEVLMDCADQFAESVILGMRARQMDTIYVASDMPLGKERDSLKSKSSSFNAPEVRQARQSIDHLLHRLNEANFNVMTWSDVKPDPGDSDVVEGLAEDMSGIFDKNILGNAEHLWAANPYCGFKSSFLGTIQILRQDRIGDPTETDWEKLGMTWVGKEIKEKFFWHIQGGQLY